MDERQQKNNKKEITYSNSGNEEPENMFFIFQNTNLSSEKLNMLTHALCEIQKTEIWGVN